MAASNGGNKDSFDVVIVGAGIAGLIAARTLLRSKVDNFIVFEARERVGGRIHCIPVRNTDDFIDLGAHFIHGSKGNQVYDFAAEHGDIFETVPDDHPENKDEDIYFTADGVKLDQGATEQFGEQFDEIFELLTDNESVCCKPGKTVGDLLKETETRLFGKQKLAEKLAPNQKKALFDFLASMECLDSAVDGAEKISAAGYYNFEDCEGERYIHLKTGYSCVLNRIAAEITPSLVRLNTVVNKIVYSDSGCQISATSKTGESYTVTAKHVLCTLPLGCLKAKTVSFSPELPAWKKTAIDSLGYGTIDRLLFFCERRWWPTTANCYEMWIIWTEESRANFKPTCQNPALYEKIEDMLWYQHLIGFEVEPTISAPVLVAYAAGYWAQVIEKLPDSEVLAVVGELITRIISPHYNNQPKAPVGVVRSKWHADPFALGSYSHAAIGASPSMFNDLAKPLPSADNPRLTFAGEATHDRFYSCVHGAWQSAEREVKRILSKLS